MPAHGRAWMDAYASYRTIRRHSPR